MSKHCVLRVIDVQSRQKEAHEHESSKFFICTLSASMGTVVFEFLI